MEPSDWPAGEAPLSAHIRQLLQEEWNRISEAQGISSFMQKVVESLRSLENRLSLLEQTGPSASHPQGENREIIQQNDFAVQLYHMNQLDQAEQLLGEAIEKAPENALLWNNLAVVQTHAGKKEDSLKSFARAISLDSNSTQMLNNQGVMALLENQPEKAVQILEQAQRSDPQRVDVLLNLAEAFETLGMVEKSILLWQTALLLDPGQMDARQKLKEYYQHD